ncbi:MAG: sulfite exporter TauE/SafE family protein [Solirubrobacterales bacterium]|nr:sulfite exporter TauE/SafE family protein [Solirubrobacterales bacterium]MCB0859776.1 sulfite exporter TauE/SafE family protein [Solirubrobacterales bacterium]
MDIAIACLICFIGGLVAGLIGVGGGIVFVPAMTAVLSKGQVEAESTSLLMIALVSVVGTWRQIGYGNVNLKDAAVIGLLSPVGVLIGVVAANALPERALRIGFAMLALYMAYRLLKRVFGNDPHDPAEPGTEPLADPGPDSPAGSGAST